MRALRPKPLPPNSWRRAGSPSSNATICRGGEIDLIARDGTTLVFVEVRLRSSSAFGGARASITAAKRRRIKFAAGLFLSNLRREPPCRFDAILLDGLNLARIEWLVDIDIG